MILTRIFRPLQRPLLKWLLRTITIEDPWQRTPYHVPLHLYGVGALKKFEWYFDGKCSVEVHSIEDIKEWLLGCEYMRDPNLFNEADFWQHPSTFEYLRKGDCEDFSLWAWRKLARLGYEAEFVAGRRIELNSRPTGHTWIHFEVDNRLYLFDTVIREREKMVRDVETVRDKYIPEVSVDAEMNRYAYGGYLQHLVDVNTPTRKNGDNIDTTR